MNSLSFLLSQYKIHSGPELEKVKKEIFHFSPTLRFTEAGKKLGIFPSFQEVPFGGAMPDHNHSFLELTFIADGEAYHKIGKDKYRVKKGDIYFLNNKIGHSFIPLKTPLLKVINFSFLPEHIEKLISIEKLDSGLHFFLIEPFFRNDNHFTGKLTLDNQEYYRFLHLALLILDTFARAYPRKNPLTEQLFRSFITLIYSSYRSRITQIPAIYEKREEIFWKTIQEINAAYNQNLDISSLTKKIGVGKTFLSDIFKKHSGQTIIEYIANRRIDEAKKLLTGTNLPVISIAYTAGFGDLSHFNHTFKKITGVTPSRYRSSV